MFVNKDIFNDNNQDEIENSYMNRAKENEKQSEYNNQYQQKAPVRPTTPIKTNPRIQNIKPQSPSKDSQIQQSIFTRPSTITSYAGRRFKTTDKVTKTESNENEQEKEISENKSNIQNNLNQSSVQRPVRDLSQGRESVYSSSDDEEQGDQFQVRNSQRSSSVQRPTTSSTTNEQRAKMLQLQQAQFLRQQKDKQEITGQVVPNQYFRPGTSALKTQDLAKSQIRQDNSDIDSILNQIRMQNNPNFQYEPGRLNQIKSNYVPQQPKTLIQNSQINSTIEEKKNNKGNEQKIIKNDSILETKQQLVPANSKNEDNFTNNKNGQNENQQQDIPKLKIITSDFKIGDMLQFINKPLPKGYMMQCSIKKEASGLNKLFPKYIMTFSIGQRFILCGKKKAGNKSSNYAISTSLKDFDKKSKDFLGKLRSNFMGTQYNIYDGGQNPKKTYKLNEVREQLGVVTFDSNLFASRGPRKMTVIIPDIQPDGDRYCWKPTNDKDGLLEAYKSEKSQGLISFFNKPPIWNEQCEAYVLNFNGRVEKASVKNFQLINAKDENLIYMQFGRVNDNTFHLDFIWPFSPFQAFAIALSSCDGKYACE